jgi:hypothetical protein
VLSEFLERPFVFHRWNASFFLLIAVKILSDMICSFEKLRQPTTSKRLQTPSAVNSNKINWNKIDKEKYKSILDEMLPVNRKQPETNPN